MVVQASSEARRPTLVVRVAAAMVPLVPMTRKFAERILAEMPTRKPRYGFEEEYVDSVFGDVRGYPDYLLMSTLDVARRAYGKYSSSRARDLLLTGQVKCFHATVILASRLTNPEDAKAVLESGKITDSDVKTMIRYNLENPEPIEPKGVWNRFVQRLVRNYEV
ncbi:TPA: hypothetical protein HA238_05390 [Candidatus Micrarchaeota archaeon]|nr:hypothetical protein [Candidatus Micrarchaeota archaeon]